MCHVWRVVMGKVKEREHFEDLGTNRRKDFDFLRTRL
jgi:hypothetical protein